MPPAEFLYLMDFVAKELIEGVVKAHPKMNPDDNAKLLGEAVILMEEYDVKACILSRVKHHLGVISK